MDFKDFMKVSEDDKVATLQHPKGHKIQIVKGSLSKPLQQQLSKLPLHQSSPDMPVADPDSDVMPSNANSFYGDDPSMQGAAALGNEPPQLPPSAAPSSLPAQQADNAPSGTQQSASPEPSVQDAYGQAMAGNAGMASAIGAQGNRDVGILNKSVTQQKDMAQQFQDTSVNMALEIHNARTDIEQKYIKPNQYLDSLSTGGKVATAIGLILGGAGSGMIGQPNPALAFLNSQIDRNLDAQKTNLGARENLLSALDKQYQNQTVRDNMFRMINANVTVHQLMASAAKAKTPMAQANAQSAAAQIENQYIPMFRQTAAIQALDASEKAGAPMAPADQIRLKEMVGIMPKEDAAAATKELNEATQMESLRGGLKQGWADIHGRFLNGALSPAYRDSIINRYAGVLGKAATGRYNQQEAVNQIASLLPNRFESNDTSNSKLHGIDSFIDTEKQTGTLDKYHIKIPRTTAPAAQQAPNSSTPQSPEAAQQWLAANPHHPQAAAVRAALAKRR